MPRGMDERFEDPSEEAEHEEDGDDKSIEETSNAENQERESQEQSDQQRTADTPDTGSTTDQKPESDGEPLNIREDWDSATIYVEPEQSEDIEVTFTRLKKQLQREDITLEKNKHFYRGVFEVAFGDHREETKEKIRELAKEDIDQ